jgi:hypothetical protein
MKSIRCRLERNRTMPPAKLLAEAAALARKLEYSIREEDLDGAGGGHCYYGGKKWLLLDVTQGHQEQLRDIVDALRAETAISRHDVSPQLADMLRPSSPAKAA